MFKYDLQALLPTGHVDEVWGLATHPSLPQFVSAGWDRLLQLWDGLSHSTVWSKDIEVRIINVDVDLAVSGKKYKISIS